MDRIPPCVPPRATARSRSLRAGWAERGAFRPPGYSAGMAECSVSYAVSALTVRKEDGTNQTACCGRGEQESAAQFDSYSLPPAPS